MAAETLILQAVVASPSLPFLWFYIRAWSQSSSHMLVQWIFCKTRQAGFSIGILRTAISAGTGRSCQTLEKCLCLFCIQDKIDFSFSKAQNGVRRDYSKWRRVRRWAALLCTFSVLETCLLQWGSHCSACIFYNL